MSFQIGDDTEELGLFGAVQAPYREIGETHGTREAIYGAVCGGTWHYVRTEKSVLGGLRPSTCVFWSGVGSALGNKLSQMEGVWQWSSLKRFF